MHDLFFLQDLAIVMTISACIMIVCRHFRLPVVLGYILAGILIGPHTPPFPLVQDLHNIKTMSEMGVIFLLFTIGLEFSLTKLKKVGTVSVIAATLEILLMLGIGFGLGRAFGWKFMDSLFLAPFSAYPARPLSRRSFSRRKRWARRLPKLSWEF